jgi:hypothetical protein
MASVLPYIGNPWPEHFVRVAREAAGVRSGLALNWFEVTFRATVLQRTRFSSARHVLHSDQEQGFKRFLGNE